MSESTADPKHVRALVEAASHAPSGDNCQPWRFHWDGEYIRVMFLADRAESLYDIDNVASWISLGAVLENISLMAKHLGVQLALELFPAGDSQRAVARTRLTPTSPTPEPLVPVLPGRRVNRRPYRRERIPEDVKQALHGAVASVPGVHLSWIDEREPLRRLARLAAANDRLLFEHRALHDGLYRWLRWSADEVRRTSDGMPIETLELSPAERVGFRLARSWAVARTLGLTGLSRAIVLRSARIYARAGAIALVTTAGATREDFVRGGQAIQRLWLTATSKGIAFQPITGITFLWLRLRLGGGEGLSPRHRHQLHQIGERLQSFVPRLGDETPIMLFRLGLASAPSGHAPRLPVDSLLTVTGP